MLPELVTNEAPAVPKYQGPNMLDCGIEAKILPELVAKEIALPPPPLTGDCENENEFKSEFEREILPELVTREIAPAIPAVRKSNTFEDESKEMELNRFGLAIVTSPRPYTRISPPLVSGIAVLVSTFP